MQRKEPRLQGKQKMTNNRTKEIAEHGKPTRVNTMAK